MKFYGNRGLRSWPSKYKDISIRWKLHMLRYELKLAWQRAWYGYSSDDIWEFHNNMSNQMAAMLRTFKEGSPFILTDADTDQELSKEDADKIYSRMIKCLEYGVNEDLCYKELYGVESWKDDFNSEKYTAAWDLMEKYKDEAFELLRKYWYRIWW